VLLVLQVRQEFPVPLVDQVQLVNLATLEHQELLDRLELMEHQVL